MKILLLILSLLFFAPLTFSPSIREEQMKFTRVREAYACKEKIPLLKRLPDIQFHETAWANVCHASPYA